MFVLLWVETMQLLCVLLNNHGFKLYFQFNFTLVSMLMCVCAYAGVECRGVYSAYAGVECGMGEVVCR